MLTGHTWPTTWAASCAAYRPDGLQLASGSGSYYYGSGDKTLLLWDVASGKLQQELSGHTGSVTCVAYRPDGLQLASGSNDKTLRLWDTQNYQCVLIIYHFISVNALAWSPRMEVSSENQAQCRLISGDGYGVKLWRITQQANTCTYQLIWASYFSRHLHSAGLNFSRVTGLSDDNHALLAQHSQSSLIGEPSNILSAVVLDNRNKQKYIAEGKLEIKAPSGDTYLLNAERWLVSLVREYRQACNNTRALSNHVYLIIQGIDNYGYTVIKEIDLVLKDKQFHFFQMIGSAKIRIHDKSPWDLKEKAQHLVGISNSISRENAEKLIANVQARIVSETTGYLISGKAPSWFKSPWQNCLSFCLEQLRNVGIDIQPKDSDWKSFFCAFPSDYIPQPELAENESTQSNCPLS